MCSTNPLKSCFESCLSPKTHFERMIASPVGQYKIVKALDFVFDVLEVSARTCKASETAQAGLSSGRYTVKLLRQLLSLVYIFTHLIPSFIQIVKHQCISKRVPLESTPQRECEGAKINKEKLFYWGSIGGYWVKGSSVLCAFICRPFIENTTHQKIMLVKHVGGFIALSGDIGYCYHKNQNIKNDQVAQKKIIELVVGLFEKSCQVLYDCVKLSLARPPVWIRLSLTFSISAFGLYRVYLRTA